MCALGGGRKKVAIYGRNCQRDCYKAINLKTSKPQNLHFRVHKTHRNWAKVGEIQCLTLYFAHTFKKKRGGRNLVKLTEFRPPCLFFLKWDQGPKIISFDGLGP